MGDSREKEGGSKQLSFAPGEILVAGQSRFQFRRNAVVVSVPPSEPIQVERVPHASDEADQRVVLSYRRGDVLLAEGCRIRFLSRGELELRTDHARFVFGKRYMEAAYARTALQRAYCLLQEVYAGPVADRGRRLAELSALPGDPAAEFGISGDTPADVLRRALDQLGSRVVGESRMLDAP